MVLGLIFPEYTRNRRIKKLQKKGFSTGEITLSGLDMVVNLPNHCFFRDDGEVSDIRDHYGLVCDEFGSVPKDIPEKDGLHVHKMFVTGWYLVYAGVIFTKNLEGADLEYIKGHEETHFLSRMLGHWPLLDEMEKLKLSSMPAFIDLQSNLLDEENVARVGGVIALYKKGLHKEYLDKYPGSEQFMARTVPDISRSTIYDFF